jgi:hypothetical protein
VVDINVDENAYLAHYGILRKSGRYPWGSGKDVPTRNRMFLDHVNELRKQGMSSKEIVKATGLDSTTTLRDMERVAKNREKQAKIDRIWKLSDHGYSNGEIGKLMDPPMGESSVRALKAPGVRERAEMLTNTANQLRKDVDTHGMLDVGAGVENHMGVSKDQLRASVSILKEEGYGVYNVKGPQLGTGKDTNLKVLVVPGTTVGDVMRNKNNIQLPTAVTPDGGKTWKQPKEHPIVSVDPKRVDVVYKEQGGDKADGIVYVRPNVDDLSLGKSRYAQVRIMVGDSHYIKGMALYKDDLPKGTDLLFHTSKSKADLGSNKLDALKKLEPDPAFPFKTVVKPTILDEGGSNERRTAINKVFEEGDWQNWSKSLSSQFLSKQSPGLAQTQLDKKYMQHKQDFDEIMALSNPAVKRYFLEKFSDEADSAAVHMEAARLHSNQRWHVILPIDSMKPTEIYAPNYQNGERVVLIRFPHAGTFEIPELVVNNKQREASKFLKDVPDAVGIHHSVAEHLSGADFDGDTVIVIPNNQGRVRKTPALEALQKFNPKTEYPFREGMTPIGNRKQNEMGKISNLITDMTLQGASHEELARAVKHSMVIIDSEKHNLDWKRSETENGIAALKKKYQSDPTNPRKSGARTLISRAGSPDIRPQERPARVGEGAISGVNPKTGEKMFVPTGKLRPDGTPVMQRKEKLAVTNDAHSLVSPANTRMEGIYADHSNRLKTLANQARLAMIEAPPVKWNEAARKAYAPEVESLNASLHLAQMNQPLERRAQLVANAAARAKKEATPNMERDTYKKVKFRELELARGRTGASKYQIPISQREWDAIQAGAISNSKLNEILAHTDVDMMRKYATPKQRETMTTARVERAQLLFATGATRAEVAAQLGVSVSTLDRAMKGENE